MPDAVALSPAEIAAQKALNQMFHCIKERRSFRLEAGAGAGKTYSLVKALQWIIDKEGTKLIRRHQKVACITYTNVATDEVTKRIDSHPVVQASTIHSFCWELCKNFQSILRQEVINIAKLNEKIKEAGGIKGQRVGYDLGYRQVSETEILLHHDDVLGLMVSLLKKYPKLQRILTARFPVLFIDEYQDTDVELAQSLIRNFVSPKKGPLIGLFGDSWQRIYQTGTIEHDNLQPIGKEANFRSVPNIVDVLNKIRPGLPQKVSDPTAIGTVKVYHSNNFAGQRQTGVHWRGDLPAEAAHAYLTKIREQLTNSGWNFLPLETKILMLTHNVLAAEQNYKQVFNIFDFNNSIFQKEDPHIAFFADTVEPACSAFTDRKFGQMFSVIGRRVEHLTNLEDKRGWTRDMWRLVKLRKTGTIGEVIDLLKETRRPRLSDAILRTERRLAKASREKIDESRTLQQIENLRPLPYSEIISLAEFMNNHTPFSTKHGVKGAEFENVLVVLGRGWNKYNWKEFLEWAQNGCPDDKKDKYEHNRNLFYVSCSRPRTNLALLFTQELSADALNTLNEWFGAKNVSAFDPG